jgi:hypothetical protein
VAADLHAVYSLIAAEKTPPKNGRPSSERLLLADYHQHFRRVLNDESLPIPWRLHVASFLADRQEEAIPLELANDMTQLYIAAIEDKAPIVGNQHGALTAVVRSLKADDSAKDLLTQWRDKWAERYLRTAVPNRQSPTTAIYALSDSRALCSALEIFLAGDDMERAKELLAKYSGVIGNLPQTVVILVKAGQPEEAAKVLRSGWSRLALSFPTREADAESLLPQLLERLDRDDERYFAKLLFASLQDAQQKNGSADSAAPATTTRDQRLEELAKDFSQIEFKDPGLQKTCLVLLSDSEAAGKQIADAVAKAYEQQAVVSAYVSNDSNRLTQESLLAKAHLTNRLRAGDCDSFAALVNALSDNPTDDDYRLGQAVNPFIECALATLRDKNGKPWTAEQSLAVGEALAGVLKGRDYVNINDFDPYNTLVVALHARAGKTDDLKTFITKVSDYSRSRFQQTGSREEIWNFGSRLIGPPTADNLAERIQYARRVLQWAFDQGWIRRSSSQPYTMRSQPRKFFESMVATGFFTEDEMKAHGEEIAKGIGNKNDKYYAMAAFADWVQSREDFARAADLWLSIVDIAPDAQSVSGVQARYVFSAVNCLNRSGRSKQAATVLSKLDGKKYRQEDEGTYDALKRDIEEAGKKEAEAKGSGEPADNKTTHDLRSNSGRIRPNLATFVATVAV